jgi:hypothetical protein
VQYRCRPQKYAIHAAASANNYEHNSGANIIGAESNPRGKTYRLSRRFPASAAEGQQSDSQYASNCDPPMLFWEIVPWGSCWRIHTCVIPIDRSVNGI